jgi:hypothetical protein
MATIRHVCLHLSRKIETAICVRYIFENLEF